MAMINFLRLRRSGFAQARSAAAGVVVGPRAAGSVRSLFGAINIWFWAIVGVPTLIADVYYFGIASDLYLSQAQFVVRGPGASGSTGGLAALFEGSTFSQQGEEEAEMVQAFIMSRDAVRKLDREDNLRAIFGRPEGDIVYRFPGLLSWRQDFEALYKAYGRFVSVDTDTSTGITTLSVKAFRPEDAHRIAASLLKASEQLVNELNERAREDALRSFQKEVHDTEQQIADIQAKLTAYRIQEKMLDPKTAAEGPLKLLEVLNTQRAAALAQLADALRNSPSSPQIPVLKTRIASLDKLIADEHSKITGNTNSVASLESAYERLDVARNMAEAQLASALKSLEAARLNAQRQQLYIETIATPNLPDYPLYPKRIVSFSMVLASCLLVYGIAWLLVASVREHAAA